MSRSTARKEKNEAWELWLRETTIQLPILSARGRRRTELETALCDERVNWRKLGFTFTHIPLIVFKYSS